MTQDSVGGLFPLAKEENMTVPYEAMRPYGKHYNKVRCQ